MNRLNDIFLDGEVPEPGTELTILSDALMTEIDRLYLDAVQRIRHEYLAFQHFLKSVAHQGPEDRRSSLNKETLEVRARLHDAVYPLIVIDILDRPLTGQENTGRELFLAEGRYVLTCTNPDVLRTYYHEQLQSVARALESAGQRARYWVGRSHCRIPLSFAVDLGHTTNGVHPDDLPWIEQAFEMPSLREVEDSSPDGTIRHEDELFHRFDEVRERQTNVVRHAASPVAAEGTAAAERSLKMRPLGFFSAVRTDFSLTRLEHYTQTYAGYFQDYIIFTNYRNYVEKFVEHALGEIRSGTYDRLIVPEHKLTPTGRQRTQQPVIDAYGRPCVGMIVDQDNAKDWAQGDNPEHWDTHGLVALRNEAQMPAYHLIPPQPANPAAAGGVSRPGITLINIGVGPSNAKNMTDHLAVLRPRCWLMLGHCAGLRHRQSLGEYVIAQAYVRDDHVLDEEVPPWVPVPMVLEIQNALQNAVRRKLGDALEKRDPANWDREAFEQDDIYKWLRVGTVATTDNRNWEIRPLDGMLKRFRQSRAIAVDMESATLAANGFRFRIPYGTLLCVSDKPTFGQMKLRSTADSFRATTTELHLQIGLDAIRELASDESWRQSRKLSAFDDPPFR